MDSKEKYYNALIADDGRLNEIQLGENLGLDEDETNRIIVQLLSEYKIEYVQHKACAYRRIRRSKRQN